MPALGVHVPPTGPRLPTGNPGSATVFEEKCKTLIANFTHMVKLRTMVGRLESVIDYKRGMVILFGYHKESFSYSQCECYSFHLEWANIVLEPSKDDDCFVKSICIGTFVIVRQGGKQRR